MTLREMMKKSGCFKGCPSRLYDIEFSNGENICKDDLKIYFNSSNFQNDVFRAMSKISDYEKSGHKYNYSFYFYSETDGKIIYPLSVGIFELKG